MVKIAESASILNIYNPATFGAESPPAPKTVEKSAFWCKAPIPHESASHSMGYEHVSSIIGEQGRVRQRRVTLTPLAAPSPPGGRRYQSPR